MFVYTPARKNVPWGRVLGVKTNQSINQSIFSHENHPFPPSLSDQEKLHFGKKSEVLVHDVHGEPPNFTDARLLDGAAVVHLLPTVNVSTFDEYADKIFLPHISVVHELM